MKADLTGSGTSLFRKVGLLLGTAAGLGAGFSGLYYGTQSVFLKPIALEMGWSRAEAASLPGIAMLGLAIGGPLLGLAIDRFGARPLIGLSALLFAACLFLLSMLPPSYLMFVTVSFGIGLLGVGTASPGYIALLPPIFEKRLGFALSIAMTGAGVGASIFPSFAQWLVGSFGWHVAYQCLAAVACGVVFCIFPLLIVRDGHIAGRAAIPLGMSYSQALRNRRFWTLMAVLFICSAGGLGAILHLVALLTDQGMSPRQAASIAALSGIGLLIGRLLSGFLMDALFAPLVAAIGFVLGAAGLVMLALLPSAGSPVLALSALLFGFALGAEGDFAAFSVRRYFGARAFGALYGTLVAAYSLGGVFGPIAYGQACDESGGYRWILLLSAAGYGLAAIAALTLGPYVYRASTREVDDQDAL